MSEQHIHWSRVPCCSLDPHGYCSGHRRWLPIRISFVIHRAWCATVERWRMRRHHGPHSFRGRRYSWRTLAGAVMNILRFPCGQSCGRCGHQWYEHRMARDDLRSRRAMWLALRDVASPEEFGISV